MPPPLRQPPLTPLVVPPTFRLRSPSRAPCPPLAPAAAPRRRSTSTTRANRFRLLEGEPEWTRDDVVRGLQERATLQQEIEIDSPGSCRARPAPPSPSALRDAKSGARLRRAVRAGDSREPRAGEAARCGRRDGPGRRSPTLQASLKEFNERTDRAAAAWGASRPDLAAADADRPALRKARGQPSRFWKNSLINGSRRSAK